MTYEQTLEYLFRQLPMFQRVGQAAYKADLKNTRMLMDLLDHPYRDFRTVHVAGTNGKGSVSHLLASVFREAGYKTGLYTSPHLVDFRERIRVNGQMIAQDDVVGFVRDYRDPFESIGLSFFEWTVGLAFHHFAREAVDIAIIEVGMGGRLDSTNVITPELSIITNIGGDHQQFLGTRLEQIAGEKAGIIKKRVPVLIGKTQPETSLVFETRASALQSPLRFADQQPRHEAPASPLTGYYQRENFQTVLCACEWLAERGWKIPRKAIVDGFAGVTANTGLRGRWETLREHPRVICDVGHNKEGVQWFMQQLSEETFDRFHLVLGFVADKDVQAVLELFPPDAHYYLTRPSIPRALPIERLTALADRSGISYKAFDTVAPAYEAALGNAGHNDLVFVGGSTFVVADLLTHLRD